MGQDRASRLPGDEDLSDAILTVLARLHPRRPDRQEIIEEVLKYTGLQGEDAKTTLSKRLGRLISRKLVDERLTLNDGHARVGLSGRALIGISLNIEALRELKMDQNDIIDEIIEATSQWSNQMSAINHSVPPIVIRDINIIHGSDQFDILLTILHSKSTLARSRRNEREDIIFLYVREVIQRQVTGVRGTQTMGLASSRAYPIGVNIEQS